MSKRNEMSSSIPWDLFKIQITYILKGNFRSFTQSGYKIDNLDNTSWESNCKLFKIPEEVRWGEWRRKV